MHSLKRLLATVAVAAVSALAATSAVAQGGAAKIIVVSHGQASDPFWSVVKNGVDAAQ